MSKFDIFDSALIFHAYRAYMRDYELIVVSDGIATPPGLYSYVFRYCVEASTQTHISPEGLLESLDDRLTDYQEYSSLWDQGYEMSGFVWGVRWAENYPGWSLVKESESAERWTKGTGFDFHELHIDTNAYQIRLVFSDLVVEQLSETVPAGDEEQSWLERFWSAPAPSPLRFEDLPPKVDPWTVPLSSDEPVSQQGAASSRQFRLSTISFHFLLDGAPIGMVQPSGADRSKRVINGVFIPSPPFETVRELFQFASFAARFPLDAFTDDWQEWWAERLRERDALNISVITAGGRAVATEWVQVNDTGAFGVGLEAEFTVAWDGFFDDPHFWSS